MLSITSDKSAPVLPREPLRPNAAVAMMAFGEAAGREACNDAYGDSTSAGGRESAPFDAALEGAPRQARSARR